MYKHQSIEEQEMIALGYLGAAILAAARRAVRTVDHGARSSASAPAPVPAPLPDDMLREIAARSGLDAGIRRACRSLALTREERLRAFLGGLERRAAPAAHFAGAASIEVVVDVQDGPTLSFKAKGGGKGGGRGASDFGAFAALALDALILRDDARQSVDIKVTVVFARGEHEHEHEHDVEAARRLAHALLCVSSRSSLFAGTRGIAMRVVVCEMSPADEVLSISTRGFGTNRWHQPTTEPTTDK